MKISNVIYIAGQKNELSYFLKNITVGGIGDGFFLIF